MPVARLLKAGALVLTIIAISQATVLIHAAQNRCSRLNLTRLAVKSDVINAAVSTDMLGDNAQIILDVCK